MRMNRNDIFHIFHSLHRQVCTSCKCKGGMQTGAHHHGLCPPGKAKVLVAQILSYSLQPRTAAYQTPLSMGFSRQEYWSGWPFPPRGDLSNPGIEPGSPTLQADSLPSETPGEPQSEEGRSIKPTTQRTANDKTGADFTITKHFTHVISFNSDAGQ